MTANAATLEGRVVLVTGAGQRLGREIAVSLAGYGADIGVHYNSSDEGAREAVAEIDAVRGAGHAHAFKADLTDARQAEELPRTVAEHFGRLDVLINSAAVMRKLPFGSVTPEQWDGVLDLNLKACFFTSQGAWPFLKERGGAIINISDASAFKPWPSYLPHSLSKAGVEALTRGLARLLAPDVRVNAIAPGAVLLPDSWSDAERARTIERTPLGRLGSPDDVVKAVVYLLNAGYVTGTTLVVDGGQIAGGG